MFDRLAKLWPLVLIAGLFLLLGTFGVGQIYHQDEYRWATIVDPAFDESTGPHPPLFRYLLMGAATLFGFNYLRVVPLFFGLLNLLLVFLIARKLGGKVAGWLAVVLFALNIYSLIAALQIDIDGALLPFFVLLGFYSYQSLITSKGKGWLAVLLLAVVGGSLTKLSYLLFLGALALDYFLGLHSEGGLRRTIRRRLALVVILLIVGGALYYFYTVKLGNVIDYAKHFKSFNFGSRAYFDLGFKVMKSLVWLSPLLMLPTLYGLFRRDIPAKYRFWFLYLLINLLFYLVIFDFAKLTIERYFMFWIAPASIISGAVLTKFLEGYRSRGSKAVVAGSALAFLAFSYLVLKIPAEVLPLNPKGAYLERLKSLNFNFLIPFSGGSGPIGFYFPAMFIGLAWLAGLIFLFLAVSTKNWRGTLITSFVVFGLGYNLLFIGEYLFGLQYGSPAKIARASVGYVIENSDVQKVITYNDIGAYELRVSGKYFSRFYTAPQRDYTKKLDEFRGHYLIVDFPAIDKPGRYWSIIERCPVVKTFEDGAIRAYVFDCRNLK